MLARALAVLAVAFLAMTPAYDATIKSANTKDGRVVVSISGEIAQGDNDELKRQIKQANAGGKLANSLRLDSIGGNLVEGVLLSETVRYAKMTANVGMNATCASACFLVFAAGAAKYANYTARIGVHGASNDKGQETVTSGAATVSMARIAKELGVPAAIIGRMVVTPPSDMVWLSPADLMSMGASMVGKPEQIASDGSPPSKPNQLPPETGARATVQSKDNSKLSWNDVVTAAARLSANQNNGKVRHSRGCQPDLKICSDAIFFTGNDGASIMVKATKDMEDRVIDRDFCTFNKQMDIRTCTNWDTNKTIKEMKDSNANWITVAVE